MDLRDFVIQALDVNVSMAPEAFNDVSDEEYRWQPAADANPICFLLLHTARTEDRYVHRWLLGDAEQVWKRDGWDGRTGLVCSPSPREVGNSWTIREVVAFPYPPIEELLGYQRAVREATLRIVRAIDDSALHASLRPDGPQSTPFHYLQRIIAHNAVHLGALDYIRGLWRSRG